MEKEHGSPEIDESRRKFIEKAGKVSVAAPAAAVLLSRGVHAQIADPYNNQGDQGDQGEDNDDQGPSPA